MDMTLEPFKELYDSISSSTSGTVTAKDFFSNVCCYLAFAFTVLAGFFISRFGAFLFYRNNPQSLESYLYFSCIVWSIIRALFFFIYPFASSSIFLGTILYPFTANVQVVAYSLMYLYCAVRVHSVNWEKNKKVLYLVLLIVNIILLLLFIVVAIIGIVNGSDEAKPVKIASSSLFLASFATFAVVYIIYGILLAKTKEQSPLYANERKTPLIALFIIVSLCLTVRVVWNAVNLIATIHVSLFSKKASDQVVEAIMFFVWELAPLTSILLFFGRIPTRKNRRTRNREARRIFNNSRYTPINGSEVNASDSSSVMSTGFSSTSGNTQNPHSIESGSSGVEGEPLIPSSADRDSSGSGSQHSSQTNISPRNSMDEPRRSSFDVPRPSVSTDTSGQDKKYTRNSYTSQSAALKHMQARPNRGAVQLVSDDNNSPNFSFLSQQISGVAPGTYLLVPMGEGQGNEPSMPGSGLRNDSFVPSDL